MRQRHTYRVTVPMFYPEGSPGHHYPSGRQGHYVEAETARTAAVKVAKLMMREYPVLGDEISRHAVRFDVQLWDKTKHTRVVARVDLQQCSGCGMLCEDEVEERYSYGVYAGRLCVSCCGGYRDNCGLDGHQGDPNELIEAGENYWEEDY